MVLLAEQIAQKSVLNRTAGSSAGRPLSAQSRPLTEAKVNRSIDFTQLVIFG